MASPNQLTPCFTLPALVSHQTTLSAPLATFKTLLENAQIIVPIVGLGGGGIVVRMYLNLQSETVGFRRHEAVLPVVQAFTGIATSHRESPWSGTRRTTIVKGAQECGVLEKAQKVTAELVTSYSGRPIRGKCRSKVPKGARGCGTRESAASEEYWNPQCSKL
ncbi:hypothetical protein H4582DRAFT_2065564 [Lactarius indigo]|nr:hypothetical protein H4582DRAFT_2065564 [Lactarius indigo]